MKKADAQMYFLFIEAVVQKRAMEGSLLRNQKEIDSPLLSYSNHFGTNAVPGKQNMVPPTSCSSYISR
jgi:hypothetical protein